MEREKEIIFDSLAYTDIDSLLNCFNESFKVYYVPLQLNKEQLSDKIYAEAIDMKLSFGAFVEGELVGFILNGIDVLDGKRVAYNAGTGVLPDHRGQKLSIRLSEYCIKKLGKNGIERSLLDVISENTIAIRSYKRMGFSPLRKMISYKGKLPSSAEPDAVGTTVDWELADKMCAWKPAWQYNNNTLRRAWNNYNFITSGTGASSAYCIVNRKNGRVAHFGGDRKKLEQLFKWLSKEIENPLVVIHVDENSWANEFLLSLGLEVLITSLEMGRDI